MFHYNVNMKVIERIIIAALLMAGGAWNEAYPQGHDVQPPKPQGPTSVDPPRPKMKSVTITTDEDGDEIKINDVKKGTSPLTIQLKIGSKYTITAVRDGFSVDKKIRIDRSTDVVQIDFPTQRITFHISPPEAKLEVDGSTWPCRNGETSGEVKTGNHSYHVSATDYYPESKSFTVNTDGSTITVKLKPKYGFLNILSDDEYRNATVTIDDSTNPLFLPVKNYKIASGRHHVKIKKPLYSLCERDFYVSDNETTTLNVSLAPNFSRVTLEASDDDVEIIVNGTSLSKGKKCWTGELEAGRYVVQTKKQGYTTTSQNIYVVSGRDTTITLQKSEAIYGVVQLASSPTNSDVKIDGKNYGTTPMTLDSLLVGSHELEIIHRGYRTEKRLFTLNETDTLKLHIPLRTEMDVTITTTPSGLPVYIDNELRGYSPLTVTMTTTRHRVKVPAQEQMGKNEAGYCEFEQDYDIEGDMSNIDIVLEPDVVEVIVKSNYNCRLSLDGSTFAYLDRGENKLKLKKNTTYKFDVGGGDNWGHKTIKVGNESFSTSIHLDRFLSYRNTYIEPAYRYDNPHFAGLVFGVDRAINFEMGLFYPMVATETIYWSVQGGSESSESVGIKYTPLCGYMRFGKGFRLGKRFRLVPQAGAIAGFVLAKLEDKNIDVEGKYIPANGAWTMGATLSTRLFFALGRGIGLSVTPEYSINVASTDGWKKLGEADKTYKKISDGFHLQAGLTFFW